jgi:hypothetical protein
MDGVRRLISMLLFPVAHRPSARRFTAIALLLFSSSACSAGSTVTPIDSLPTSAASPLVFDSTVYPYRLSLPAVVVFGSWTPAIREGQPDLSIYTGAATNDQASTVEGTLFIVGAPWSGTLQDLETQVVTAVAEAHDCKVPVVRKDLTLGANPAIGFTQTCTTTDLVFTRVVVIHEGYALAISLGAANQAKTATILDVLADWLTGLTWTTP